MKTNIKTLRVILICFMLLVMTVEPILAQERESKTQVALKAAQTNPEFSRRFSDADLNAVPKSMQDPKAVQRSAVALVDDFCNSMSTTVTQISNAQGCFLDVTYSHTYTYGSGTNPCFLPGGFYIEFCTQAQIQSVTVNSGAWLSGTTPVVSGNSVYWVKNCPNNFSNVIPSGQALSVRIKLTNGFCPGSTCNVKIRELMGIAFPNNLAAWTCEKTYTVQTPAASSSIGPDISICTGTSFAMSITPPPAGALVKWYKYQPATCNQACPPPPICPVPTNSQWVLAQTGGNVCNTNILTNTTCYVAVIESGCRIWSTNVKRVNVCPGVPGNTISVPNSPTTLINGIPHACNNWSGQLCLVMPSVTCCVPKIVKWEMRTRGLTYSCTPNWGAWSSWSVVATGGQTCINTGNLGYGTFCQKEYEYRAVLSNACGQSTPTYNIVIDKPLPATGLGTITENPLLSPLCYKGATKLTFFNACAEVVQWEKRKELSPCSNTWGPWTIESGSQGTCVWWTNPLDATTQYRVKVKNGICTPVYSQTYTVKVKPKLTVSISANQTVLCPPGVTFLVQTSYGTPCSYPVSYQWYRDGLPISLPFPYRPTTPGNYYVVASDGCGKAKSNVITICARPTLVIEAPCCICKNEKIILNAVVLWSSPNCVQNCTYTWSNGATGSSISVIAPGAYTVTVSCGICPPLTQTVTIAACLK